VYKQVPETRTETRTVCERVPVEEERTVMEKVVTCKPVTCTVRKCVDRGHYECREVPCCSHRLLDCLHKLCRRSDCCDPCADACCPPPTKTVQVWVPCKVWEEVPVTRMERVCEYRPKTCKVTVCKTVQKQIQCQVTCMKCVPEQQTRTCTVMVQKSVPYQATRTVCKCVPVTETVTATRMVARTVEKEVPCCETAHCFKPLHGILGRLCGGHHGCGDACCN